MTHTDAAAPTVAFFDVDETLIRCKSMFSFLSFFLDDSGREPGVYEKHVDDIADLQRRGGTREDSNRAFYGIFAGAEVAAVEDAGRRWFAELTGQEGMINEAVEDALATHRCLGHVVVLVSGSFAPCLEPVRRHVDADVHRGTELEVCDGRYTGAVVASRIGAGKALVARETMEQLGADPADCFAYGDHVSDLDMLAAVGNPVVVGDDEALRDAITELRGDDWRRLPAHGGAPIGRQAA